MWNLGSINIYSHLLVKSMRVVSISSSFFFLLSFFSLLAYVIMVPESLSTLDNGKKNSFFVDHIFLISSSSIEDVNDLQSHIGLPHCLFHYLFFFLPLLYFLIFLKLQWLLYLLIHHS